MGRCLGSAERPVCMHGRRLAGDPKCQYTDWEYLRIHRHRRTQMSSLVSCIRGRNHRTPLLSTQQNTRMLRQRTHHGYRTSLPRTGLTPHT